MRQILNYVRKCSPNDYKNLLAVMEMDDVDTVVGMQVKASTEEAKQFMRVAAQLWVLNRVDQEPGNDTEYAIASSNLKEKIRAEGRKRDEAEYALPPDWRGRGCNDSPSPAEVAKMNDAGSQGSIAGEAFRRTIH